MSRDNFRSFPSFLRLIMSLSNSLPSSISLSLAQIPLVSIFLLFIRLPPLYLSHSPMYLLWIKEVSGRNTIKCGLCAIHLSWPPLSLLLYPPLPSYPHPPPTYYFPFSTSASIPPLPPCVLPLLLPLPLPMCPTPLHPPPSFLPLLLPSP